MNLFNNLVKTIVGCISAKNKQLAFNCFKIKCIHKIFIMKCVRCLHFLGQHYLSFSFVVSLFLGLCLGEILKKFRSYTDREVMYVGFLGEIFMRMLSGVSLPLLTACIIVTFALLDTGMAKIYGTKLTVFIIVTKIISLITGMTIGIIFKPGIFGEERVVPAKDYITLTAESVDFTFEILHHLVPRNFVEMLFTFRVTNITRDAEGKLVIEQVVGNTANVSGIAMFAILAGFVLKGLGDNKFPLLDLVIYSGNICFAIVKMILYVTPFAVISSVTQEVIRHNGFTYIKSRLAYTLCLFGGLMINFLVIYPLIVFFVARENPLKLYWKLIGAMTIGFVSSSSITTFPLMIKILKHKMGYDHDLVKFVTPICVALNKDGDVTALALSSIFLAQHVQGYVELQQYVAVAFLSVFVTVATPEIVEGSIMSLITILQAIGVPPEHVGMIMALGLLVDRIVTVVNVTSCAVAVAVLSRRTAHTRLQMSHNVETVGENIPEVPMLGI